MKKKTTLLTDVWKNEIIQLLPKLGRARLIPLNKVWPGVPGPEDFRPITVLSHMFKWLESRFLPKLNRYLLERMQPEQTGFVPYFGTQVNIRRIVNCIKNHKKSDNKILLFIDYKAAYNTVNRKILYQRLRDKNILNENEIQFIQCLHSHIHYKCENDIYYYENGVPQGSMTSPALFDIYSEIMIENIREKYKDIIIFAYADDMAFILDKCNENEFIKYNFERRLNLKQNK